MSKTWFNRKGKKRTAAIEMLDGPIDDTRQGTYYEDGETAGQYELESYNPYGTRKRGKKPDTEVTAGGNS